MDMISSISGMQSMQIRREVAYAVAAKTLDAARQQGAAAIQLLQAAAEVGSGGGSPHGVGDRIDVTG